MASWGIFGPNFIVEKTPLWKASWGILGGLSRASWRYSGTSWSLLGASWGSLGASWGALGSLLGPPWDLSQPTGRIVRSGFPSGPVFGAVLGASWASLEDSGAVFGRAGVVLGRSWRPLGPCWGVLGGLLGRLGAPANRKGENAKIIRKRKGNHHFVPLGALLGGLLEASWGVLKAS